MRIVRMIPLSVEITSKNLHKNTHRRFLSFVCVFNNTACADKANASYVADFPSERILMIGITAINICFNMENCLRLGRCAQD